MNRQSRFAKAGDWKTRPMPDESTVVGIDLNFTPDELEQIKRGDGLRAVAHRDCDAHPRKVKTVAVGERDLIDPPPLEEAPVL